VGLRLEVFDSAREMLQGKLPDVAGCVVLDIRLSGLTASTFKPNEPRRRFIFGIVALESAGVPLPGETILVAAALLAATTGQMNIVVVVLAAAAMGYLIGRRLGLPFFADTVVASASMRIDC
jgi:hypothetical protein